MNPFFRSPRPFPDLTKIEALSSCDGWTVFVKAQHFFLNVAILSIKSEDAFAPTAKLFAATPPRIKKNNGLVATYRGEVVNTCLRPDKQHRPGRYKEI